MGQRRGRVSLADRILCIELVRDACQAGARKKACCELLGVDLRRLERWEKRPLEGDQRKGPRTKPQHTLTSEEKKTMIKIASSLPYRDLCPWQIVAKLADSGKYIASESSFYRVLKENNLLTHRERTKPRVQGRPKALVAKNPNEIWSWDITYLKSSIKGKYYYLYLALDIFSRMIVGYKIEEEENSVHGAELIHKACEDQRISKNQLILHSDNGAAMKGATMFVTLQKLGVVPSFSRPAVSDDNPYSESLFKTLKYRPSYPDGAFASIEEARSWVGKFVTWYNTEHLHSGIRFVTPFCRHQGKDIAILKRRAIVYENAKIRTPLRWSGATRNWSPIREVHLNPPKETKNKLKTLIIQAA